jgi:hypothetical protein
MNQQNILDNQEHGSLSDVVIIPYIEENVPLPRNSHEALPDMSNEREVMVRAQTIKELSDLTGEEIAPDAKNIHDATQIATDMVKNPEKKQDIEIYPNETITFLAGMVGSMNHMIVKDLADLKLYVVNKLVNVVENTDNPKEQIAALRSIGEVDGVDAFKKKTEVLHKVESIDEVEKELIKLLNEFKSQGMIKADPQTIDAELVEEPVVEEIKEKSFDDIVQEAADGSTTGD